MKFFYNARTTPLQLQRYKRKQEYQGYWFVQWNNKSVFSMKSFSIWDKACSHFLSVLNLPHFWIKDYVVTPNQQKQLFSAFLSKINNESGIGTVIIFPTLKDRGGMVHLHHMDHVYLKFRENVDHGIVILFLRRHQHFYARCHLKILTYPIFIGSSSNLV